MQEKVSERYSIYSLGNENFYELLSTEILRKANNFKDADFLEIYYLMAIVGIKSEALATSVTKRLFDAFSNVYSGKKSK